MPYLIGAFRERAAVIEALRSLRQSGYESKDVDVFSPTPLDIPQDVLHRRSHASLVAVAGAVCTCLGIVGFVYFAQHDYPIITGGMPIFSFWSTGVVFYEVSMSGATIASLLWFLYDSGLLSGRRKSEPRFSGEGIGVRVRYPLEREPELQNIFAAAGAANFKREDKRP